MKRRVWSVLLAGVLSAATVFTGTMGVSAAETEVKETEQEIKTIGTLEEGAFDVQLKNNTGKDIKEIRIKVSGKTEFEDADNLLEDNDVFAAEEERILYYHPETSDDAKTEKDEKTEEESDTQEKEPAVYDVKLIFADDTEAMIHTFPFGDIKEGEICLEGEVAYLIFESLSLKEEINTLETETEIAEKIKAASQPAQKQNSSSSSYSNNDSYNYDYSYDNGDYDSSYDNGGYDDYYEDDSSYDDYDYDTGDSTSDDGGNEDSCLDGGLLY